MSCHAKESEMAGHTKNAEGEGLGSRLVHCSIPTTVLMPPEGIITGYITTALNLK